MDWNGQTGPGYRAAGYDGPGYDGPGYDGQDYDGPGYRDRGYGQPGGRPVTGPRTPRRDAGPIHVEQLGGPGLLVADAAV